MMKNFFKLTLALALILVGATTASAQKFGRVDLAAIVPNMPEYKEALTNLEALGQELSQQLEQMQVEFNNKMVDYEKNYNTYNDSVRKMKETELRDMQERLQGMQQIAQQDMQKKEAEVMNPIYEKANEAVKKHTGSYGRFADAAKYIDPRHE